MSRVIIIGGGAAGILAAVSAATKGHEVCIYEKMKNWEKIIYHRKGTLQCDQRLRYADSDEQCSSQSQIFIQFI